MHFGDLAIRALAAAVLLSCLSARLAIAASEDSASFRKTLIPGVKESVVLEAGRAAEFQINLKRGDFASIDAMQLDGDIACFVRTPGDASGDLRFDREVRGGRPEKVEFVAPVDGVYVLTVERRYLLPASVTVEVLLAALATSSTLQQDTTSLRRRLAEANSASRQGDVEAALVTASNAILKARAVFGESVELGRFITESLSIPGWSRELKKFAPLAEEAAGRLESVGEADPDKIAALEMLALSKRLAGESDASEKILLRILDLRTKQFGPDHPLIASILGELAAIKRARGDQRGAMELSVRSLNIREKWLGPDHRDLVLSLQNVAAISYSMGDLEGYLTSSERSLQIRRRNLPADHPDIARSLTDIANIRIDMGEYDAAERLLLEAIRIYEKALGKSHVTTTLSRFSLAITYQQREATEQARNIFDEIWESLPQLEPALPRGQATYVLQGLGNFYVTVGNYQRSESALLGVLERRLKLNGPDSLEVSRTYDDLARLLSKMGRVDEALSYQRRSNDIVERNLTSFLLRGSEQQKLNFIEGNAMGLSQSISLHAELAPDNPDAAALALQTIINRKGRVLDALLDNQTELGLPTAAATKLREQLVAINTKLSDQVVGADSRNASANADIERLIDERRQVYRSLGQQTVSNAVTVNDIRAQIPSDTALIEFKVYRPFGQNLRFSYEHVIAYIVRRDWPITWAKLGRLSDIEPLVAAFRRAMKEPGSDSTAAAKHLSGMIALPILSKVGDAKRLIISPDGPLSLVPFQALIDADGRYLVERFTISYATSGRELARKGKPKIDNASVAVFADPEFGVSSGSAALRSGLPGFFQPLRSTRREADKILELFPSGSKRIGPAATESALKSLRQPAILHIATHGFFLADPTQKEDSTRKRSIGRSWKPEFQLFRSGLVFAGANTRPHKNDDGVLTALEASTLDLRGTELVVLSACDTGVGVVKNGEGVYGLRRAFTIAGAEALVMSLWQVSDQATQELMSGFYRNLRSGSGRADALRDVQLQLLRTPARKHPFYWASFIHTGDWTAIESRR